MRLNFQRTAAFAAAAAMCAGFAGQFFSPNVKTVSALGSVCEDSDPVSVFVILDGDPAANGRDDIHEFVLSEEAAKLSSAIEKRQETVMDMIRKICPQFEPGFSYRFLTNGFSCRVPENLIPEIRRLPFVKNVSIVKSRKVPQLFNSPSVAQKEQFVESTSCTGSGTVIAVIDTELNISHDMFAPVDEKYTRISYNDIADIIDDGRISDDVSASEVYVSSKLPFVHNYTRDDISDPDVYHGTHVAGIAAGNSVNTENGTISGIAPDAQILFMGVSDGGDSIDDDAVLAAFEDAVVLGADVINMSFGNEYEAFEYGDPLRNAVVAAEDAGIIVCQGAGNAGEYLKPAEFPQFSTISDSCNFNGVMSVAASSGNDEFNEYYYNTFFFNGSKIYYSPVYGSDDTEIYSLSTPGSYETVCGDPFSIQSEDIEGKIAAVSAETYEEYDLLCELINNGFFDQSAALVFSVPDGIDETREIFEFRPEYDAGVVSQTSMNFIQNTEDEKIIEMTGPEDPYGSIMMFSSYGVTSSLELEPDITAPGSEIYSAAYPNDYDYLSGTSMATPFISGCAALACEYFNKTGPELVGRDRSKFIKDILMNTAVPAYYEGIPVSPRKQGAGIVSLKRMTESGVIVTGSGNEAKINLFDEIENEFDFELNLNNFSENDVIFDKAELVLETDKCCYMPDYDMVIADGSQKLECSADLSSLLQFPAGENRTETVSVTLDPEQLEEISREFTEGFFIEGYLLLSGSENNCDISVPLLGFRGDWDKDPLISDKMETAITEKFSSVYEKIKTRLDNGENISQIRADISEQLATNGTVFISNNYDGVRDFIPGDYVFNRPCFREQTLVSASDGVRVDYSNDIPDTFNPYSNFLNEIKDGMYTSTLKAFTDFRHSRENPEIYINTFYIDNTKPEVNSGLVNNNGNYKFWADISDRNLDCVVILGKKKEDTGFDPSEIIKLIGQKLMITADYFEGIYNSDLERMLDGYNKLPVSKEYNFIDVIPIVGKTYYLEYDTTDFEYFSFAAVDKAFNTEGGIMRGNGKNCDFYMHPGIWRSYSGDLINISADRKTGIVFSPYSDETYEFSVSEDQEEMYSYCIGDITDKNIFGPLSEAHLFLTSNEMAYVYDENNEFYGSVRFIGEGDADSFFWYTDEEIRNLLTEYTADVFHSEVVSVDLLKKDMIDFQSYYLITAADDLGEFEINANFNILNGNCSVSANKYYDSICMYRYDNSILRGDTDRNGYINAADLSKEIRSVMFPYTNSSVVFSDLTYDGAVNAADLIELKNIILNS